MAHFRRAAITIGRSTNVGGRTVNLDRLKVVENFAQRNLTYAIILDGGEESTVVDFVHGTFHEKLVRNENFLHGRYSVALNEIVSSYDPLLRQNVIATNVQSTTDANRPVNRASYSGCTLAVMLIDQSSVYYSNVGDCRIIQVQNRIPTQWSEDHFPRLLTRHEKAHFERLGARIANDPMPSGKIEFSGSCALVTKNVGNLNMKDNGFLQSTPHSGTFQLDDTTTHILMITDAAYRQYGNSGIVNLMLSHAHLEAQALSDYVIDHIVASPQFRSDNASMILFALQNENMKKLKALAEAELVRATPKHTPKVVTKKHHEHKENHQKHQNNKVIQQGGAGKAKAVKFNPWNGGSSGNTLWMGNIYETMDEQFIQCAFNSLGVNVQNIKIIRNKDTGLSVGYGFITFDDRNTTQNVLHELNGKKIPNIDDDKRFFLKPANRQSGGGGGGPQQQGGRLSIFVGNLTPDIDDEILMSAFMSLYPSVASAKVITADGQSKGFGFVSFEDEYDYQAALGNPNMMLGQTPISISRARHSGGPGGKNPRYQNQGDNGNIRSRRQY